MKLLKTYRNDMNYISLKNNQTIALSAIPELDYASFLDLNLSSINSSGAHCVNYFGFPNAGKIKLICCIADDELHSIRVSSSVVETKQPLLSFTKHNLVFEK